MEAVEWLDEFGKIGNKGSGVMFGKGVEVEAKKSIGGGDG